MHPGLHVGVALACGDREERKTVTCHGPGGHVPVAAVRHEDDRAVSFVHNRAQAVRVHLHVLHVLRDPFLVQTRRADHLHGVQHVREGVDGNPAAFGGVLIGEHGLDPLERAVPVEAAGEGEARESARKRAGKAIGHRVHHRAHASQRRVLAPTGEFGLPFPGHGRTYYTISRTPRGKYGIIFAP